MPGHEGPIDEGSLFDRPLSLCDSPDSSKLCEEMERSDTLKSRPGHLGSGLSIESTISALDMQLSKMQPPHSPEKTVDQLFDSLPKLFLSDPTKNRKRVEELDFQFQLLSEPSPNKKMKISQEGRTPKETSESEDLEAVTKQMDSRIYKELESVGPFHPSFPNFNLYTSNQEVPEELLCGQSLSLYDSPNSSELSTERKILRKDETFKNEDPRIITKGMDTRAYEESMKSKYMETEHELHQIKKEFADLKSRHEKLESFYELIHNSRNTSNRCYHFMRFLTNVKRHIDASEISHNSTRNSRGNNRNS